MLNKFALSISFVFTVVTAVCAESDKFGPLLPKKLAIYYGRLSQVNGGVVSKDSYTGSTQSSSPLFTEVGELAGVQDAGNTLGKSGVAWGDYDNDGHLDLYLANNGENRLYRNKGDGTFEEKAEAGLNDGGLGKGVAWGDYDNDGDLDLVLANYNEANGRLYRNDLDGNGTRTFADVTSSTRSSVNDLGAALSVAWGDYDNDGDLDLYVVNEGGHPNANLPNADPSNKMNRLYRNDVDVDGNRRFNDVGTDLQVANNGVGRGVAWGDYDNDGDLDLYLATPIGEQNRLYRNEVDVDGNRTFNEVGGAVGVNDTEQGFGVSWGDYDNDGDLDLYVANGSGQENRLYQNENDGIDVNGSLLNTRFVNVGPTAHVNDTGEGSSGVWGDYDNDGDLDLYVTNARGTNRLYQNNQNNGERTFTEVGAAEGVGGSGDGQGAAWGDYDNDGDLDLYVVDGIVNGISQPNRLYRNNGTTNRSLVVKLVGTRSNRDGIGAQVTAVTGKGTVSEKRQRRDVDGGSGLFSQSSLPVEFGFGSTATVDELSIRWPSGTVQTLTNVATNQVLTVTEPNTPTGNSESEIVDVFDDYNLVIFGEEVLQDVLANSIVKKLRDKNTLVYGRIPLGMSNLPAGQIALTINEIKQRVDYLKTVVRVNGIFLDQAGYEFGVSRQRQNDIVDYIHDNDLDVFINAREPDDVFKFDPVTGETTHLTCRDIYLLEGFQVTDGSYQDEAAWREKADKVLDYKQRFATQIAAVATASSDPATGFDQKKFDYSWYSTLLYGFDAMGWGEAKFSALDNSLPYHIRPNEPPFNALVPDVTDRAFTQQVITHGFDLSTHTRTTMTGTVEVNTSTREGRFSRGPLIQNLPNGIGIYVWTDEISSEQDQHNLIATIVELLSHSSQPSPLGVILLSNFRNPDEDKNDENLRLLMWPEANLHAFNKLAHGKGLKVYALYTTNRYKNKYLNLDVDLIATVGTYNARCLVLEEQFDGIAMNYEGTEIYDANGNYLGREWPSGILDDTKKVLHPSAAMDIQFIDDIKASCAREGLSLHFSLGPCWVNEIEYGTSVLSRKPAYQHIIDIASSVDIQTVFDKAPQIEDRTRDEVWYANQQGKGVFATIEMKELTPEGMGPNNTFYQEGEKAMWEELKKVDFGAPFTGFLLHFYRRPYNSGMKLKLPGQPPVEWPAFTPASSNPVVTEIVNPTAESKLKATRASLIFPSVTKAGLTLLDTILYDPSFPPFSIPLPPSGFRNGTTQIFDLETKQILQTAQIYDLHTTAEFDLAQPVTVCINYSIKVPEIGGKGTLVDETTFGNVANLKLFQFNYLENKWEDITKPCSLNPNKETICGSATFALPEKAARFGVFEDLSLPSKSLPPVKSIYVLTDEIGTVANQTSLIEVCKRLSIDTILLSGYARNASTPEPYLWTYGGAQGVFVLGDPSKLSAFNQRAHAEHIKVYVQFGSDEFIEEVVEFNNAQALVGGAFDGYAISSDKRQLEEKDITVYENVKKYLPLHVSLRYNAVDPDGQPAYQRVLGIAYSIDVITQFALPALDAANEIVVRTQDAVRYGNTIKKSVYVAVEIANINGQGDQKDWHTFYEEGETAMLDELVKVHYDPDPITQQCVLFSGFALHSYKRPYNSGMKLKLPKQPPELGVNIVEWPAFTPAGDAVVTEIVDPSVDFRQKATRAHLTFTNVTQAGLTLLDTILAVSPPPSSFKAGTPQITYDLQTTAIADQSVRACINYSSTTFEDEARLRLFQSEGGLWKDITTPCSAGMDKDEVCGNVSLSSLAAGTRLGIFESSLPPPPLVNGLFVRGVDAIETYQSQRALIGACLDPVHRLDIVFLNGYDPKGEKAYLWPKIDTPEGDKFHLLNFIELAHWHGLKVYALFENGGFIDNVASINGFDGYAIDLNPSGPGQQLTDIDIQSIKKAKDDCDKVHLKLHISITHYLNDDPYRANKHGYEYVIDNASSIDVKTLDDNANGIVARTGDEVLYSNAKNPPVPVFITAETKNFQPSPETGKTFAEEGETAMWAELKNVKFGSNPSTCLVASHSGFMLEDYKDSYNLGSAQWPIHPPPPLFTEVGALAGVQDAGNILGKSGVAWGDYDTDGYLDLYLANAGPNRLYRNKGDGTFEEKAEAGLNDGGLGKGAVWGDYDNDGDLDLALANSNEANGRLFRNDLDGSGNRIFADVTASSRTTGNDLGAALSVAWGDYDNDGDLDLYVVNGGSANRLYRNDLDADGNRRFNDVGTDLQVANNGVGRGVAWGDYDNDGDLDLYLATPIGEQNRLYQNELGADGNRRFNEVGGAVGVNDTEQGFGVAWGDYDNDGDLDLYVANGSGQENRLYQNDHDGTEVNGSLLNARFVNVGSNAHVHDTGEGNGVAWGDYDNDGDLDLYVTNARGTNRLYQNNGDRTFTEVGADEGVGGSGDGQGAAWGDYDNDGDLDLYVVDGIVNGVSQPNRLYRNNGTTNRSLAVKLVGTGTWSNRDGIGAQVTAVTGKGTATEKRQRRDVDGGSGLFSQSSLPVEFGFGGTATVDELSIRWPSGTVQKLADLTIDRRLSLTVNEPNTPLGSNVTVSPTQGVVVAFESVALQGETTVTTSSSGPATPFPLDGTTTFYDISTTAAVSGPIEICITYPQPLTNPTLWHYEGNLWKDVTIQKADLPPNTVCGNVTSLSPFAVVEKPASTTTVTVEANFVKKGATTANKVPVDGARVVMLPKSAVQVHCNLLDATCGWDHLAQINTAGDPVTTTANGSVVVTSSVADPNGWVIYIDIEGAKAAGATITGGTTRVGVANGDGAAEKRFTNILVADAAGLTATAITQRQQRITGSVLEITYPDTVEWDGTDFLYPFIFTSDSEWEVDICGSVPQGYRIVGDPCRQLFLANETKVSFFEVEETGSPEPHLGLRGQVKHQGKVKALTLDVPGKRKAKGHLKNAENAQAPTSYALHPAHPNPFNPVTQIAYQLPEPGEVELAVYDLMGQKIRVLAQGHQEAGFYQVDWDGQDEARHKVASGIYLCRLKAKGFEETRRMALVR